MDFGFIGCPTAVYHNNYTTKKTRAPVVFNR